MKKPGRIESAFNSAMDSFLFLMTVFGAVGLVTTVIYAFAVFMSVVTRIWRAFF